MPGPRVFTVEQVNEMIPRLESVFGRLDRIRSRLRALQLRVNALEMIWGSDVHSEDHPDHGELGHHLAGMQEAQEAFERVSRRIPRMGGKLKSVEPALVDFYGVREGRLVSWCWTRGESHVEHWHHVDQGFAQRQSV